ncbi:angiopoietin-4-like, partial [Saccostrea cucullata]|uniref:angiopoietin-4-like n=1 Tax=Saccostrea cuccullata TaxID=36930 RepID=UPI002ED10766
MRGVFLIYLLLCIYESFGHATFHENDETKKTALLPSTTSGKQLKIIRGILNQESLSRFSMIQKIDTLVMDAIYSKNFSQALEKRLSEVVKELGDLKINDYILQEENTKLKEKIEDLYSILSNYTTVQSANVQSLNDSEISYLKRKTSFVENQIQTLSLQNFDINKQLVFLMKRDLNSLKNETIGLNEKYDKMLQENYAFQNQSIMNGRKSARLIERLLSMENGLRTLVESFNKTMENYHQKATDIKDCIVPFDCYEIYNCGRRKTGVYRIFPYIHVKNFTSVHVICDMELDGGGWTNSLEALLISVIVRQILFQINVYIHLSSTVIQHRNRENPHVNFNATWGEYKRGFGDVRGNYWIGNDVINKVTTAFQNDLYIRIKSTNNQSLDVKYNLFSMSSEASGYMLSLGTTDGYDAFRHFTNKIHHPFSTYDHDKEHRCGARCGSGW